MLGPTPECIPIEDVVTLLDLPPGAALRVDCERHVAACVWCSTELALYREFQTAEPKPEERQAVSAIVARLRKNSPAAPEPWWSRIRRPRFLAPAAVALAAAAVLLVVNPRRPDQLQPVDTVMRSAQINALSPAGDLDAPPSVLQWSQVPGAARYDVRLLEVDRTELWRTAVNSNSAELPASVRARITPSKKLLWEVNAIDSSGKQLTSSGLQSFTLKP
jgi:hypothetical protein